MMGSALLGRLRSGSHGPPGVQGVGEGEVFRRTRLYPHWGRRDDRPPDPS